MLRKLINLILICLIPTQAFAAYTASAVMEMNVSGGSNLNSGVFDSGVAVPGTDYSQATTSQANGTNLVSANGTNATPTVTAVTYTFTTADEGNTIVISSGTNWTVSVFVITDTSAGGAILDKACGSVDVLASGTWREGGAYPMGNSTAGISDDARLELLVAGNTAWFKNGTFTTQAVSLATATGTITKNLNLLGYNSSRADNPTGSNRPVLTLAANSFNSGSGIVLSFKNIMTTSTSSAGFGSIGNDSTIENCKFTNTSTSTSRNGASVSSGQSWINNEFVSQNGIGSSGNTSTYLHGNYYHDSDIGISAGTATSYFVTHNIFENIKTTGVALTATAARVVISNNTFYGSEAKIGTGISATGATTGALKIYNNIFYGLATGISIGTAQQDAVVEDYNDFNNNTTDRSLCATGTHSITTNPTFTGASQVTGTTGQATTNVLTQSGGDFSSVTANVDYLRVTSGTGGGGVTAGIYLITGTTATTLTVNNNIMVSGTSNADIVYTVPVGHNLSVGTNMKALGFPGAFNSNASETTGYLDIGAAQRQEAGSSTDLLGVIQ